MSKSKGISAKEKIRKFLQANVGKVVSGQQIRDASGGVTEWARRVRELRLEEGWPIETHNDNADLKPGEYLLTKIPSKEKKYTFSRKISLRTRSQVLERNGYTCQMCGAGAGDVEAEDSSRTVRLHIGHIVDFSHGGQDTPSNLRALCSNCNEGAKNLTQEPPSWIWLLSQIRRANVEDQKAALKWLKHKFREP